MSQEFKNPFLEGSEEVPGEEAIAAAKQLAEEAKKARRKATDTLRPKHDKPAPAIAPKKTAHPRTVKQPAPAAPKPALSKPNPSTDQASVPQAASSPEAVGTSSAPSLRPPASTCSANDSKTICVPALITDIIIAVIAIVLTLLLLQDVLPF